MLTDEQIDAAASEWVYIRSGRESEQYAELRDFARAIEALVRAECVPQWQPIETAPKDGTLVLVREPRCSGLAVMYSHGWKYESGSICYLEPTHWMPLPAAPGITAPQGGHL